MSQQLPWISSKFQTSERRGIFVVVLFNNAVLITYVARMGEMTNAHRTLSESLEGRYRLVVLNVDWKMILR
jgi:hypothetical protein